jgi:tRNA-Thr(GGU) m(6)t(6)A37 methyltransferase TsaA
MIEPHLSQVLELRPIGHVKNGIQPGELVTWEEIDSQVVIDPEWGSGLEGLEEFSHIIVIFWLDRPREEEEKLGPLLKVHPEAREDMPLVGVFATRSPHRPNPIALTVVELLGRDGNVLHVRGLDAFNGTPVLDIKPYLTRGDLKKAASVPKWLHKLWEEQDEANG